MKALSTRNDDPEKASRPFDINRDGFIMGEGAGIVILELLENALDRGAKIYAELIGYGMTADAYHITSPSPGGEGAARCMKMALKDGGIDPLDVNYINAHATSTPLGDVSEYKAIEKVFNSHLTSIHVSATKSMTGHLLGGAGAIEAIACLKAIEDNMVPPTINLYDPDSEINPKIDLTPLSATKNQVDVALNNTFGFGGHTVTTLFRRYYK
jgi:3-oxoacyl-[acyl-carrier-protein] synthase II